MNDAQIRCPFCDSPDVEKVGMWGGQLITTQLHCRACNAYFEAVRRDLGSQPDANVDRDTEL